MGAIQNSLSQATGSIAGAAILAGHLKAGAESAKAAKASNEAEAMRIEAEDVPNIEAEIGEKKADAAKIMEEHPEIGTPAEESALAVEAASGDDALPDSLAVAKESLSRIDGIIKAKTALKDSFQKRIELLRGGKI